MEDTGECAPVLNAEDFDSLDDAKHSACMMTFGEAEYNPDEGACVCGPNATYKDREEVKQYMEMMMGYKRRLAEGAAD